MVSGKLLNDFLFKKNKNLIMTNYFKIIRQDLWKIDYFVQLLKKLMKLVERSNYNMLY